MHIPIFFVGVIIADMETIPTGRPLDWLRNLSIWWKIPINLILFTIFITYGSYGGDGRCHLAHDGTCGYWYYATIFETIPKMWGYYAAAISLTILALTSEWFQWILGSAVF